MPPKPGYKKRVHKWTPEMIIRALQYYAKKYGETPTATDFNPSDSRRCARIHAASAVVWLERAQRVENDNCYPYPQTVQKNFGSWDDGIKAAGLEPRKRGVDPRVQEARFVDPNSLQKLIARARSATDPELLSMLHYQIAEESIKLGDDFAEKAKKIAKK